MPGHVSVVDVPVGLGTLSPMPRMLRVEYPGASPGRLQYSFISYRLAAVPSTAQVALEAGNSPKMIFGHHRARLAETHQ